MDPEQVQTHAADYERRVARRSHPAFSSWLRMFSLPGMFASLNASQRALVVVAARTRQRTLAQVLRTVVICVYATA